MSPSSAARAAASPVKFKIEDLEDGFVAIFEHELGPDDGAAIKEEARKRPRIHRIIIDLTPITLITTPGLGALVAAHKFCREHQIRLILCGLSPYVREIFDLTRLSTIFEVTTTRADARA